VHEVHHIYDMLVLLTQFKFYQTSEVGAVMGKLRKACVLD